MNAAEYAHKLHAAKAEIDEAMAEWLRCIEDDAAADDEARRAHARAFVTNKEAAPKASVGSARSDGRPRDLDLQRKARHAEGLRRAAQGAFDARKQFLSALQSLASLSKSETQLATWTPREVESA